MFIIVSGRVLISKRAGEKERVLAILEKDEIVGELAIFNNEARSATAKAMEEGAVIRIMGRRQVEEELKKLSPWVGRMITGMSGRFENLNRQNLALRKLARVDAGD